MKKSKKKHQLYDKVQRIHGEGLTKFLNNKKILSRLVDILRWVTMKISVNDAIEIWKILPML